MKYSKPLILEVFLLCVLLPSIIILGHYGRSMFVFLWSAAMYGFVMMSYHHPQALKNAWKAEALRWQNIRPILLRWILVSIGLWIFLSLYHPASLFDIIRTRPQFMLFIFLVYPVLSALPQEFIFCTYFFTRYESLFHRSWLMVLASATTFAYAHMLYVNPVAPILGFLAGLIFARTYARHRSLALVTLEHALYGNSLFLIGLGHYFFSGAIPK